MNQIKICSLLILLILFQSCFIQKNKIFWVSGIKTECSAGAGKIQCLNVHRGESLNNPHWENFYANIVGFKFEEGYLKKLKVKEEQIENFPVDGSSIKYTFVKELEKKVDYRININGKWVLNRIDDSQIDRSIRIPEMEIKLNQMQLSGISGCNNYSGKISELTSNTINFDHIVSTQKACIIKHIEQDYFNALKTVSTYQIKHDHLVCYDKDGKEILSYMKKIENKADRRIHDIWTAIKIMGNPLNRAIPVPRMEINLTEMKVFGNDGCNDYTAELKEVSDTQIVFGAIASTKKMCLEMETTDKFIEALSKVRAYRLVGVNLILINENGEETIAFLKSD